MSLMNKYILTVFYACTEILMVKMYIYLNLLMKLVKTLIRKWAQRTCTGNKEIKDFVSNEADKEAAWIGEDEVLIDKNVISAAKIRELI